MKDLNTKIEVGCFGSQAISSPSVVISGNIDSVALGLFFYSCDCFAEEVCKFFPPLLVSNVLAVDVAEFLAIDCIIHASVSEQTSFAPPVAVVKNPFHEIRIIRQI